MKIISLDFELQGVFDRDFFASWICEAAGGFHPDEAASPPSINGQSNPWKHNAPYAVPPISLKGTSIPYDAKKAKLAAQNGLKDNEHVTANREAVKAWLENVSQGEAVVWLGQNFRAHDWQFIKTLGWPSPPASSQAAESSPNNGQNTKERPPIIDTLELSLLLHPEAKCVSLRKDYKGEGNAEIVSFGSGASQTDVVLEDFSTKNEPQIDAKSAYKRACESSQFAPNNKQDGGLLCLIKSHPLKPVLDKILLRDAPHTDWLKKDWEAVINWQPGNCKEEKSRSCDEILEDIRATLDCKAKEKRASCPLCSTETVETPAQLFTNQFCQYLDKEPFACAYFVCWLARVQGTGRDGCPWKEGIGKFSPHPWITQNYPAVLHLIRLYFAGELKAPPTRINTDRPNLLGWLDHFSSKARGEKWEFKGRYVEVPAALKNNKPFCPKFSQASLEGVPPEQDSSFGIHQADVIGRILGHDTKEESGRLSPADPIPFSPSGIYVAPTGFGKSLCYQLPAFIMAQAWKTLTVVISPLQALQADQVRGMAAANPDIRVLNTESAGVPKSADTGEPPADQTDAGQKDRHPLTVAFYNSSLNAMERALIRQAVRNGDCDMLFIAPEQLLNPGIADLLACRDIGLVALDEAHCLSAWGQSFRPEYMYIAKWLDGYCEDRLKRLQKGFTFSPSINTSGQASATDKTEAATSDKKKDFLISGLDNLCWRSHPEIKKAGPCAPYPRAALFTATLEPEATRQLQGLFLPGMSGDEAADFIVGGYAPREEISIEIYPDILKPFSRLALEDKNVKSLYVTTDQKQRAQFARRLGVLCEFLLEPFHSSAKKRLFKLPVLIYSTTVKQTELLFGKPAVMFRPWGLDPVIQQLPLGLGSLYFDNLSFPMPASFASCPMVIVLRQGAKSSLNWKPAGFKDVLESINYRATTIELPLETPNNYVTNDYRTLHWKRDSSGQDVPEHEIYPWVLALFKDNPQKLMAHKLGLLLGLMADDSFFGKTAEIRGLSQKGTSKNYAFGWGAVLGLPGWLSSTRCIAGGYTSFRQATRIRPTPRSQPKILIFRRPQKTFRLDVTKGWKPAASLSENTFQSGRAAIYHGRMEVRHRRQVMDAFTRGGEKQPNLILCTNAFGMGVDRGDICSVILLGMPGSLNDLLQQVGRAKRNPRKMKTTLGLPEGQTDDDPPARAIVLTHTEADAQIHRFLLLQSRVRADHLDRVWKSIQSTHARMKSLVKSACGADATGKTTDRFPLNPIENCAALDKITVSLADLRREWANIQPEDLDTDLVSHRSASIEARYGLHDLDDWDETMDQRLRQCLYWLERLGYIERLPNCPRVARYETKNLPPDEAQNIEQDLKTLFGEDGWCADFLLPAKTILNWRKKHNQEVLRHTYKENASERASIMCQWTKFLHDQLSAVFGCPASPCACRDPNSSSVELEHLPECLPLKSRAVKYLLHPLLVQKLRQIAEPTSWSARSIYEEAQDILHFLKKHAANNGARDADFGTYRNARKLFTTLRRLGWITEYSSITLVVKQPENISSFLDNVKTAAETFLGENNAPKRTQILRTGANGVSSDCLIGYLTIIGAIHGITDRGHAQQAAKEQNHIKAVNALSAELVKCAKGKCTATGTASGPLILEINLNADSSGLARRISDLRKLDPLYRYDAQGALTAFIGWLQHWQRDNILVQEGNGLLTQAYTLRVLKPNTQENLLEANKLRDIPDTDRNFNKRFPDDASGSLRSAICEQLELIENFLHQAGIPEEHRVKRLFNAFKEKWEKDYGIRANPQLTPPGDEAVHAVEDYNLKFLFQAELDKIAEEKNLKAPELSNFPAYKKKASEASVLLDDSSEYALAQIRFLTHRYIETRDDNGHVSAITPDRAALARDYYDPSKTVIRDIMSGHHRRLWILQEVRDSDGSLILPKPSFAQQQFIKDTDPFIFLEAGPGTGKTATLIRKLMWLVHIEGVPAEKIAFIAFNVAVAKSIKRKVFKVADVLGLADLKNVFIGTCHAFIRRMLGAEASGSHTAADKTLQEGITKLTDAQKYLPYIVKLNVSNTDYYIGAFKSTSSKTVLVGTIPEYNPRGSNGEMKDHSRAPKIAEKVFKNYRSANNTENVAFSAEIVANAIREFCSGQGFDTLKRYLNVTGTNPADNISQRPDLRFEISHLLIDEVQDIADKDSGGQPGIGTFLRQLVHWGREYDGGLKSVIAVGDPDQGIYEYAGGSGKFLQDFQALAQYPNCPAKFENFINGPKTNPEHQ